MEPYPHERQTEGIRNGVSERRYNAPGLVPADLDPEKEERLLHYRWDKAHQALLSLAEVERDPFDDVILHYVEPRTGSSLFPCLGFYLQMIRPGVQMQAHRHNSSAVYFVLQGSGKSEVDSTTHEWSKGDVLVIAPSAPHRHSNAGGEPAILFSVTDIPLLKCLGFYRQESL